MILKFNYANCLENAKNTIYPNEANVSNIDEVRKVINKDYVLYMKMLGIIEKKTVCKKGIKTYTVNYRVVVL